MRKLKKLVMCVLLPLSALLLMGDGQVELPKPDETPALPTVSEVQEQPVTLEDIRTAAYVDVPADSQNYDTVCYVSYHGILQGVGSGRFDLYSPVDRATVVTVLYRMSGEEAPAVGGCFPDVPADSWYAEAVAWAVEAEITTGTAEGTFSPLEPVTRGQLAVFLARYFAYCGNTADSTDHLEAYTDGADVPTYAVPAMSWALENGLYRTIVADTILPDMPVSRVQLAQILLGFHSLGGDALAGEIFSALPDKAVAEENTEWNDAVQSIVRNVSKKYGAIGVQVAVVKHGVVSGAYACGWATKDTAAMTTDHKMRVASISKVALGITAQLLKEEGTVALDESIGSYWGFPVKNPRYPDTPITLRSILTHTSSIINAGDDVSRLYSSVAERLQQRAGFSSAVPGKISSWNYNNYAYAVLGMTLELAADEYVDDILQRRLFRAMDIDAAFAPGELDPDLLVTVYRYGGAVGRSVAEQLERTRWAYPGADGSCFAGGLTISAQDLAKLVALLVQDGRYEGVQLLPAAAVAEMERYDTRAVSGSSCQGLALRYQKNSYGRQGVYFHTGSAYGVYNCLSYDPVTGDGVVVLTSGASGKKNDAGIYKICAEISDQIYHLMAQ